MPGLRSVIVAAMAALVAPALFALDSQIAPPPANTAAPTAVPGTLNYIEGSATLDGQPVNQRSIGNAILEPDQVISTTTGHAEVLLTPGVYLRLGPDSAAEMVSPDLADTSVKITRGYAAVEVDLLFKENNIHVIVNNVPVQLTKPGLYAFNADRSSVLVFKGEAAVDRSNGKWTTIKDGHQLSLAEGPSLKSAKFDVDEQEQSDLYRWSSLRSDYLAEANEQIAGEYGDGYAPGWYWDPYMWDYTFLGPYPFYSPFGWGFYPLGWGGFYGGYGYGGYYGRGFYGHGRGFDGHPVHSDGGFRAGGFHGGDGGFHGGGFGGGGFHGGGGFGGGGGGRR